MDDFSNQGGFHRIPSQENTMSTTQVFAAVPQAICYGVVTGGTKATLSHLEGMKAEAIQDGALCVWTEESTCLVTGKKNISLMAEIYTTIRHAGCQVTRH
jgi:hypothetical protein